MKAPLVTVEDLGRVFDVSKPALNRLIERLPRVLLHAVSGVTFQIPRGETFALVGESGSGKSTVARLVVGLMPPTAGDVVIDQISMTAPGDIRARQRLRRRIQMVFQDPYASLNPRWRAADIVAEPIRAFKLASDKAAVTARVGELLFAFRLHPLLIADVSDHGRKVGRLPFRVANHRQRD